MRKLLTGIVLSAAALGLLAQTLQHVATAINIEVRVNVFKGKSFVDDLTIDDFELFEDGKVQKIEAVYLIHRADIRREETRSEKDDVRRTFTPETSRQFVLLFELEDVLPRVEDAVSYFFDKVILPGDKLIVATPVKTYHFKEALWGRVTRTEMAAQLIEKLRIDTLMSRQPWKGIEQLEQLGVPMEDLRHNYVGQRYLEPDRIKALAGYLKKLPGQKNVFMFLQQDLLYYPEPPVGNSITSIMSGMEWMDFMSMVASYSYFPPKHIKRAFADSSILFHFIYVKDDPRKKMGEPRLSSSMGMIDTTSGMFNTLKDLSAATGGLTEVSANPSASFRKAVDASEHYYLLYYAPKDYVPDGKFRNIRIRIKKGRYRVIHRAGYIAD